MYGSYFSAAFSLRAKPSFPYSSLSFSGDRGGGGDDDDHRLFLQNSILDPRNIRRRLLLLNGHLLRHSTLLLLSSPSPAAAAAGRRCGPHACRCLSGGFELGRGFCYQRWDVREVCRRSEAPRCRCCGFRRERSDLGAACRRLEAPGCRCCGSRRERSELGVPGRRWCSIRCGRSDLGENLGEHFRVFSRRERRDGCCCSGRAVQEVWEYKGGEWPPRRCSMECPGEDEEVDGGWEAKARLEWRERGHGRFRECDRRRRDESDYDEDDDFVWRREGRERKEKDGWFRDSGRRRREREESDYDEGDGFVRQRKRTDYEGTGKGRSRFRDYERRRRRDESDYEEDDFFRWRDRRERSDHDYNRRRRRREDWNFDEEDDFVQQRERREGSHRDLSRASETRRGGRERKDFKFEDTVHRRKGEGEPTRRSWDDRGVIHRDQVRSEDGKEEAAWLLASHREDCEECDYDEPSMVARKPTRMSELHEDDTRRASSSRHVMDARKMGKEEALASKGVWYNRVDRQGVGRSAQAFEGRDGKFSSSVGWAHDERDDHYNCAHEDERLARRRDSRTGMRDVRVITEDDTSLASTSKNASILRKRSDIDQQVAAQQESRKSLQKIMEISEVRDSNAQRDLRSQRFDQENSSKDVKNRSSSVQNSVQSARDSRKKINQHNEVDQQVVALTDSRKSSEWLMDISVDSNRNVSRAAHSQRNYDELRETESNDTSTSVQNLTHVTRDKKRYVNQQVIHETDIDVQNITHIDVTKVRAGETATASSSQSQLETRTDDRVLSTSAVNRVDRSRERQEHTDLAKVRNSDTQIAVSSQSNLETRMDHQSHLTSAVNLDGSMRERQDHIDVAKVRANDTETARSSQSHLETRTDGRGHSTSDGNLVNRMRERPDIPSQRITQYSRLERDDEVSTPLFKSSREEASSAMITVEEKERSRVPGDSQQQTRSEAVLRGSLDGSSSSSHSVKDSVLESVARLEKSGTFHVGQFVDELHKEISEEDAATTSKEGKSIKEGMTRSSSRSGTRGPSDEMWDVTSATSQETFKSADQEEGSSAAAAADSAAQTPKTETAIARRVHKSLWTYVADIIRLGWLQRGGSHDSTKESGKKGSSSYSQGSEGWYSGHEHDDDTNQKKSASSTPKEQQKIKIPIGKSHSSPPTVLGQGSVDARRQVVGVKISDAGTASEADITKGGMLAKSSSIDVLRSGGSVKVFELGTTPEADVRRGGVPEVLASPEIGTRTGGLPEVRMSPEIDTRRGAVTELTTIPNITKGTLPEVGIGKEGLFAKTSSMQYQKTVNPEAARGDESEDSWRKFSSSGMSSDQQAVIVDKSTSSARLKSPASGSMRSQEKLVISEAPEVVRTEGKDAAELKRRKLQRNKQVLKETFDDWEEAYLHDAQQRKADEYFMREALVEAQRAADTWEVPVGAVLVQNGEIIARGCNLVEELRDSTAHAEMICIREASNQLRTWRLADTTLYVTLEPCAMCAGAILQARIDTVVWGAPNKLLGADGSWVRLFPGDGETNSLDPSNQTAGPVHPFHPKITIRRGVLATECSEIMQQFFQLRRKNRKSEPPPPPSCLPVPAHPVKFFSKIHNMFNTMFCM